MKMVQSSITLAFLLAGADAFAATPECKGHTGDLAMTAMLGLPCSKVLPGHVADKPPGVFDCEFADGSANIIELGQPGLKFAVKDACPEQCGNPCAHAPTEDLVASSMMRFKQDLTMDCPGAKAAGLCESDMVTNWFCGESCRSGAQWDECSFAAPGSVFMAMNSAEATATRFCARPWPVEGYAYGVVDANCTDGPATDSSPAVDCTADGVADCMATVIPGFIATADGTCPSSIQQGADCFKGLSPLDYGSTQVNQCPSGRRRKLSTQADPSPYEYVTTEVVFTLSASGSK